MTDHPSSEFAADDLLRVTADIVSAYVSKNTLPAQQVPELVGLVFAALSNLKSPRPQPSPRDLKPAVAIRKSVMPDYLICLEDGRRLKMLKRHLKAAYNMSPDEYRTRWNLPPDYPMVAPSYAKQRSKFAKDIGLGRRTAARPGRASARSEPAARNQLATADSATTRPVAPDMVADHPAQPVEVAVRPAPVLEELQIPEKSLIGKVKHHSSSAPSTAPSAETGENQSQSSNNPRG